MHPAACPRQAAEGTRLPLPPLQTPRRRATPSGTGAARAVVHLRRRPCASRQRGASAAAPVARDHSRGELPMWRRAQRAVPASARSRGAADARSGHSAAADADGAFPQRRFSRRRGRCSVHLSTSTLVPWRCHRAAHRNHCTGRAHSRLGTPKGTQASRGRERRGAPARGGDDWRRCGGGLLQDDGGGGAGQPPPPPSKFASPGTLCYPPKFHGC